MELVCKVFIACALLAVIPSQTSAQGPGLLQAAPDSISQAYIETDSRFSAGAVRNVSAEFADPVNVAQMPLDASVADNPYYAEEYVPEPTTGQTFLHDPHASDYEQALSSESSPWFALNWKKHRVVTTVIPGSDTGLGLTTVDLRTQLSFKNFPLLQINPRTSWHFLDGPDFTDVPNNLYEYAIDFSLFLPLNSQWSFLGGVAPGLFTDNHNTSSDAYRVMGRALFLYKQSEYTKWAFGIVYLDRDDVSILPAVGVTYSPAAYPNLVFDIMFPKPKISYSYFKDGDSERTIYLGGEFGGGTWAIQRSGGTEDVLTYGDLKLALGMEHQLSASRSWFVEAAYVFNRDLEFTSGGEFELDDTGMIRAGIMF